MMATDTPFREVEYLGTDDPTFWLYALNEPEGPVIVPYSNSDPRRIAVAMELDENSSIVMLVPRRQLSLKEAVVIGRLWFCNICQEEFCDKTTITDTVSNPFGDA
jgi:hypothetical protein